MADKLQVTAFISARDKQDKNKTIKELMEEFNFTESTAVTYYSHWKKNYMKGGVKVDTEQKIMQDTISIVKADEDRKQLLEKIEELKKVNAGLKNHLSMCISENEKFKFENESLVKQLAEQAEESANDISKLNLENQCLRQDNSKIIDINNQLETKIQCLQEDLDYMNERNEIKGEENEEIEKMKYVICKMTMEKYCNEVR